MYHQRFLQVFFTVAAFGLLIASPLALAACSVLGSGSGLKQIEGRPQAPAPVDGNFRSDPPDVVGATGRPQFIELFGVW